MIELSHVSKYFGNFKAVDDISFSIPTGQIVGLLGTNGAGKTTLCNLIPRFYDVTKGEITIDDTVFKSLYASSVIDKKNTFGF